MIDPPEGAVLAAALAYRARGWSVIPVVRGSKRPAIRWVAYQAHVADVTEIRNWYRRWPDANLAIVTGAVSGLVVVDIDPGHSGTRSLTELVHVHGPLPPTIEAVSGGGGRHLYFAHPGGEVRNKVGLARGIDLRADGGFIVAPPSLHASGRPYRWRAGQGPGEAALAAMPAWLRQRVSGTVKTGHSMAHWRALVGQGVGQGERNSVIASLTGHLLWHGVDSEVAMELMLCWNRVRCRPPLTDDEVVRTVASVTRLHRERSPD